MPERDVTQTLATYINADGATSYALQSEAVTVHHDNIKAFEAANGTAPAAKRRPPKKPKGG